MNKIKKFFYKMFYALPFGLKAADTEIMGSKEIASKGQEINQQVSDERVAKHLLKGEIAQSVKELRYRTYKVDDESKNYDYIGNGVAIKKDEKPKSDKHKFSMECKLLTSNVLDELEHVNGYGVENYTLNIEYLNPLVKFKIEQFATQIDVEVYQKENTSKTIIHFSLIPNGYEKKSAPFINEAKRLIEAFNKIKEYQDKENYEQIKLSILSHYEMASSIASLNFITNKATNDEPDLMSYTFTVPTLYDVYEKDNEILFVFHWSLCDIRDIKSQFYDETMERKYRNKEKKNVDININATEERVERCEICGKEISVYDADITRETYGKAMCQKCLIKFLKERCEL